MKFFAIADMHFGHEAVIRYCNRPYQTVQEMDEDLIKRWNETVSNKDTVLVLGDVCFGNKEYAKSIINRLNGKKILIMGNHDNWSEQFYRDAGFHTVSRFPILWNNFYLLSHAPLQLFQNVPYKNIFGHVHNDPLYQDTENRQCVSVERIDYRPILLLETN